MPAQKTKWKPKSGTKRKKRMVDLDQLPLLNLNAAGIDVGSREHYVAVPVGRDQQSVRKFPTFTRDLEELANWLQQCRIDTVVMEATGIYWIPLFQVLERRGFEVLVVNARHAKNVPGRKTDVLDCQWLQLLHTYGLLTNSFHPPDLISTYRTLCRHRENLIAAAAMNIQHMQKAMLEMNIHLSHVLSDVAGQTGQAIIRAIIRGERDPLPLAKLKNPGVKASEEELVKALEGNWREGQLLVLEQEMWLYDAHQTQLKKCDERIKAHLEGFADRRTQPEAEAAPAKRARKTRKNEPQFDLQDCLHRLCGVDLTRVDGLDVLTVQAFISEVGVDMTPWATGGHFASWLGLSPNHRITGGKILKRRSRKVKSRAATALRIAAWNLFRSQSALGAMYRRFRTKLGAPKAITAMAHKLARIIYHLLKHRVEFNPDLLNQTEANYQEYQRKRLNKLANSMGFELVPLARAS